MSSYNPGKLLAESRSGESTRRAETIFNSAKARVEALPLPEQPIAFSDLPELRVRNNAFVVGPGNVPPHTSEIRLKVAGMSSDFLLREQCITPQASTISLQRYDFGQHDSDRMWAATMMVRSTSIMAQGYGGLRGDVFSVQLLQRRAG